MLHTNCYVTHKLLCYTQIVMLHTNCYVTHKFSYTMELKFIVAITVIPKLVPALGQMNAIHVFICYLRSVLLTCAHPRLAFPIVLYPSVFPSYFFYAFILCISCAYRWSHQFCLFYLNSAVISGESQVMRTASATECFRGFACFCFA